MSLASCSNYRTGARFIPYNPLTFQQDSVKAAGLGVTLSQINEALVIAHPANGGKGKVKIKIKNSFNTEVKEKSKVVDKHQVEAKGESIIGDRNAPVEAKKHAIIGDGNTKEEQDSLWWLWLWGVLLVAALLVYLKYG
ncbi:hypothetical protein OB13_15060 [Pontibacter sp. HJ8]